MKQEIKDTFKIIILSILLLFIFTSIKAQYLGDYYKNVQSKHGKDMLESTASDLLFQIGEINYVLFFSTDYICNEQKVYYNTKYTYQAFRDQLTNDKGMTYHSYHEAIKKEAWTFNINALDGNKYECIIVIKYNANRDEYYYNSALLNKI